MVGLVLRIDAKQNRFRTCLMLDNIVLNTKRFKTLKQLGKYISNLDRTIQPRVVGTKAFKETLYATTPASVIQKYRQN